MTGVSFLVQPPVTATQLLFDLAPLAASHAIRCGSFAVSAGALACAALLERESTEEAQILRQFLEDDPWSGMGSVRPGDWLLIARDDHSIVFGQRNGQVGVDRVVTLTRNGERYDATRMESWDLIMDRPDERAEVSFQATAKDNDVHVVWECGAELSGQPTRTLTRVELHEDEAAVHFLLVSAPNPDSPTPRPWTMSVGTGMSATAQLTLHEPLGQRSLMNNARVPAIAQDLL